ncbi:hypothetical protein APS67_000461 [Streptomyces sp. AVP053U2]|nr:hypothetical protein APS67_000461 [Streptomyces sp. AVP053U2]
MYFAKADASALYVTPYSPSELTWSEKGVTVTQTTRFPEEQVSTLTIGGGPASFALPLRVPAWATGGFRVTVNGRAVPGTPVPGGYFSVRRTWRAGDTVRVLVPFRLRAERALDDPTLQTLFLGPVNVPWPGQPGRPRPVDRAPAVCAVRQRRPLRRSAAPSLTPVSGKPLHHTLNGVGFAPFAEGTEDPTHACFRRSEPRVVFGAFDAGVANPARGDGVTLLDEIWAGALFGSKGALVTRVRTTVADRALAGLPSGMDGDRAARTAQNASYAA